MSVEGLFRGEAKEDRHSDSDIDAVLRATRSRSWLALGGIGLLVATAVVWGFTGRVNQEVRGQGILVRSGGVLEVVAPASGRVVDVPVTVGDTVSDGQTVGWLAQPAVEAELEQAEERLEAAQVEIDRTEENAKREAALELKELERRETNLRASIRGDREMLRALGERLENQRKLLEEGLIARSMLLATRKDYEETEERIRSKESDLMGLELERTSVRNGLAEARRTAEVDLHEARTAVERLRRKLESQRKAVTPYTGRVLEIVTRPGEIVDRGQTLLSLQRTGPVVENLMGIFYVPPTFGKMVESGMVVRIDPSTVHAEEYGMMVGHVTFVSDFPSTSEGMMRVLQNETLVESLSSQGAPYEVHVSLQTDPSTPSRYRWTSSEGPSATIESGTMATGFVSVKRQRPAELVFPALRQWTGF